MAAKPTGKRRATPKKKTSRRATKASRTTSARQRKASPPTADQGDAASAQPLVVAPGAPADQVGPDRVGGKAANLALLEAGGFLVPRWFAVTTAAWKDFCAANDVRQSIAAAFDGVDLSDLAALREVSARSREAILTSPLPSALKKTVSASYRVTFGSNGGTAPLVAVRSSMVGEDAAGASFAGQMDSFLFVRNLEGVLDALRRCWASAFGDRAVAYRHHLGLNPTAVEAAVVIQEMVDGEVSGVLFTLNPLTGATDEVMISSVFGLGEGLVSGLLDADSAVVGKADGRVRSRETAHKTHQVIFDTAAGHGTLESAVPTDQQGRDSVDADLARQLAQLGEAIEAHYDGIPQDVEWTLRDGQVHVLQARPVTATAQPPANAAARPQGRLRLWDNSNIIESYSGVTSPLTFSFARTAYREVYRQFLQLLGVPRETIDADDRTLRNMLGLLRGRIYYNLNNWYKLVSYLPGFEFNREFMEQMMGVRESASLLRDDRAHEAAATRGRLGKLGAMVKASWVGVGLARAFWHLERDVKRFMAHFEVVYTRHRHTDLESLDEDGLAGLYDELENQLLRQWRAPIVNDFSAMIFFGLLRKLSGTWVGDESDSLHNDLMCGEGGIESTEPSIRIMGIADVVRRNQELRDLIEQTPPDAMHAILVERQDDFPALWAEVEDYLDRYGDRCMMELKLEEPNLRDDPSFLYAMIRNYVAGATRIDPDAMARREREIRGAAEKAVRRSLGGRPLRLMMFQLILKRARAAVKNRENMRFARTKIFGLARRIFQAMGRRLHEKGLLDAPEDVFYLEVPEIFGTLDGTLSSDDLAAQARLRRARFDQYRSEPAPADRVTTHGVVYQEANSLDAPPPPDPAATDGVLRGLPACPGRVTEAVRVIRSPQDEMSLGGQILVAERTDPGWVPLFPSASGLLIERGSLLSHSAIVAREMGIPAIVSIPDVTHLLSDGQRVTMDAREGVVYLDPDDAT